jgi:hypothetical protein
MTDTDKILQTLERLEVGQQALRQDVKSQQETGERRGKLLAGLTETVGTILQEQQAQRMDIRSLHDEVRSLHDEGRSLHNEMHATKEELKSEILASRAEAKRDKMDLKATVVRKLKSHEQRIDDLEDAAGIPHPDEN